ncbi:hypothetical protein KOW79_005760 [Hemibagrus wyckioides]|uniref:Uncharacterized protein n=1 Tax=Hemibagrus wyckioides TaxID=337641 RepID=A0A9D3SNY4_9TELE|nr:hypothetical protein KOW79_005760 [Hemibagrus wyckioides]
MFCESAGHCYRLVLDSGPGSEFLLLPGPDTDTDTETETDGEKPRSRAAPVWKAARGAAADTDTNKRCCDRARVCA